jgi:hypothetical protein
MTPIDFDKDHDPHMRVVAAIANLRARNYRIPEADIHTGITLIYDPPSSLYVHNIIRI